MRIRLENIPTEMHEYKNWVLWRSINRDGNPTKVPFSVNGKPAKSNDPETWSDFETVVERMGEFDGIGFMFSKDDPFCGIDLDGCRDTLTGRIAEWAKSIIVSMGSYAEVSPSATGVKIFCRAKWVGTGKKTEIKGADKIGDKTPAIEVYDHVRFFTMTGQRLQGMVDVKECQEQVGGLQSMFWTEPGTPIVRDFHDPSAVYGRAKAYLAKMPYAVSGQDGHGRTYHAACVLCQGFELREDEAMQLLSEWNVYCEPPWSERELSHKIKCAMKENGQRGYLKNVDPRNFEKVSVPRYRTPEVKPEPRITMLDQAAENYLEKLRSGEDLLIETGIPELDYAIGGGAALGELFLVGARPSHGKSMGALQMVHHWTSLGIPSAFISEEMSALAIGKRTVQYVSSIHQEHWRVRIEELEQEVKAHFYERAKCVVVEQCRTAEAAAESIRRAHEEFGVKCVIVDYAQLLQSKGRSRYEQVTNTSVILRQVANDTGVLLVALCQLGRSVEDRFPMIPRSSDLKDSGQLEQDADVVVMMVWPHRVDSNKDPKEFQMFIGKNRNRAINQFAINCQFDPMRQRLIQSPVGDVSFEEVESRYPQ